MNHCNDSDSDTSTRSLGPSQSEAGPSKPSNETIYSHLYNSFVPEQDSKDKLYSTTSVQSLVGHSSSYLPLSISSSAQTLDSIVSVPILSASSEMRKVSFAPTLSVISTELSEEPGHYMPTPNKSLCSRFLSNLASLKNYTTRRAQRESDLNMQSHHGYPRLCPRNYPPPPPPSTASHPHTSQESQAHTSHSGSSQTMSDNMLELLYKDTASTLEQHTISSGLTNHSTESISSVIIVKGTCSLSLFTTLSIDSLNRIERCSSAPSFLIHTELSTVKKIESESYDHLRLFPTIDSTTSDLPLERGASNDTVPMHTSTEDLTASTSSTLHSVSDSDGVRTDSCSLHRSIHQLVSDPSSFVAISTISSNETASSSCVSSDMSSESNQLCLPDLESPVDTSDTQSIISSSNSTELTSGSESYSTNDVPIESEHTQTSLWGDDSDNMHMSLLGFTSTISSCNETSQLTQGSRSYIDSDVSTESQQTRLSVSDTQLDISDSPSIGSIETDWIHQLGSSSSSCFDSGESVQIYPSLPGLDSTDGIPTSITNDIEHTVAIENGSTLGPAILSDNKAEESVQGESKVMPDCEVADVHLSSDQLSTSNHYDGSQSLNSASNDLSSNTNSSFNRDLSYTHSIGASLIDVPSLISTLKHVASLLSSSHAMLDLSLSTLQEKLHSQPSIPSNYCVCVRKEGQVGKRDLRDCKSQGVGSKSIASSKSEPLVAYSSITHASE